MLSRVAFILCVIISCRRLQQEIRANRVRYQANSGPAGGRRHHDCRRAGQGRRKLWHFQGHQLYRVETCRGNNAHRVPRRAPLSRLGSTTVPEARSDASVIAAAPGRAIGRPARRTRIVAAPPKVPPATARRAPVPGTTKVPRRSRSRRSGPDEAQSERSLRLTHSAALWASSSSGKSRRRYFTCDETREMDRSQVAHVAGNDLHTDRQAVAVHSDRRDCGWQLAEGRHRTPRDLIDQKILRLPLMSMLRVSTGVSSCGKALVAYTGASTTSKCSKNAAHRRRNWACCVRTAYQSLALNPGTGPFKNARNMRAPSARSGNRTEFRVTVAPEAISVRSTSCSAARTDALS